MPTRFTPGQRVTDESGVEYIVVRAKRNGMIILRPPSPGDRRRYYAWKNGNKLGYSYLLGEPQKHSA